MLGAVGAWCTGWLGASHFELKRCGWSRLWCPLDPIVSSPYTSMHFSEYVSVRHDQSARGLVSRFQVKRSPYFGFRSPDPWLAYSKIFLNKSILTRNPLHVAFVHAFRACGAVAEYIRAYCASFIIFREALILGPVTPPSPDALAVTLRRRHVVARRFGYISSHCPSLGASKTSTAAKAV
jgi:hypothetical protein